MQKQAFNKIQHSSWASLGGSDGKESACNAGDLVQSLGWEDPLEEDMATLSSIVAWRIHGQRCLIGYSPWDRKELDATASLSTA